MVKLRIRELKVVVQTAEGEFGVQMPLKPGLTVIHAENSSGKSTLVQSIIYVLGLEAMLSPKHEVPLPHAMTHMIDDEEGNRHAVISSEVHLEIENQKSEVVTVSRSVKGEASRKLITVIHGPALSSPPPTTPYRTEDKYVSDPGAATTPQGFHYWLASYLDWELPEVTTYDGRTCPLYVQCMFPLVLIEQKKAWTGIQARMPTQFRIRDAAKRAIEFILKFSVFEVIAKTQILKERKAEIQRLWQRWTTEASTAARQAGGIINGLTDDPMEKWAEKEPVLLMLHRGNEWIGVRQAKEQDQIEIQQLETKEIPVVSEVSDELTAQLRAAEDNLQMLLVALAETAQDVSLKRSQVTALETRLRDLAESLDGNKALLKFRKLGSKHAPKSVQDHRCPTCHQEIDESLLPQDKLGTIMSVEDSIKFAETQQSIYRATKDGVDRSLAVAEAELTVLREREAAQRATIRALKTTLVSEGHAPSRAAIEALQAARSRLDRTTIAESLIDTAFIALKALCPQWAKVLKEQRALPDDDLSPDDRKKLTALEKIFQAHAAAFDVRSVAPNEITLSRETYKPEYQGFDLEFDLSASDLIRTIWAYLHALLELARTEDTNHPGLLVLDEPRQQETKPESFEQFFKRAQESARFGQQVIVATSQKMHELVPILAGVEHKLISFTTKHVLVRAKPVEHPEIVPSEIEELEGGKAPVAPIETAPPPTEGIADEDDIPF